MLVELNQEIDGGARLERDRSEQRLQSRADRLGLQIRRKLVPQVGRIGEREFLRIRFGEEVERVEHLEIGEEIDNDRELGGLFGKDETRQPIAVRVLLPVHEVLARGDVERVARHARAAVRRRPQTDHLRAEVDRAIILIARGVMETDQDRHRTLPRELLPRASVTGAPKCESPFIGHDRSIVLQFSDRITTRWSGSETLVAEARRGRQSRSSVSVLVAKTWVIKPTCLGVSRPPISQCAQGHISPIFEGFF